MANALPASVKQGTIANNGDSVIAAQSTANTVGVQITGTWTGTLTFKACLDGVNFTTLGTTTDGMTPWPTGGAGVNSTTANGIWTGTFSGLVFFQVIATSAITGSATVTINLD